MEEAMMQSEARVPTPAARYPRPVRVWLWIGLVMVFGQIVIGGITRLTESGLSITKWEVVSGTLPPLTDAQWQQEFDLYRQTPQYAKINQGISMSDFKFIYFWEYFHRLWARTMGLVFIIPFVIFWRKGWLDGPLMRRLGVTVLLAALAASFGWIMVASGLINRPWVNAYKLTMHLSLGCILYAYLLWTTFRATWPRLTTYPHSTLKTWLPGLIALLALQIVLGGIMSGSKAALFYPTWPDLNGAAVPDVITTGSMWTVDNFVNYDASLFLPALVQFLHRSVAYLLVVLTLYFAWRAMRIVEAPRFHRGIYLLISLLISQVLLGILTVINSQGEVPVSLGVMHQAGAILLLSAFLYLYYLTIPRTN